MLVDDMKNKKDSGIEELKKKPDRRSWERFYANLKKSRIKQYRVIYKSGKLKNRQDLYASFVELFDASGKLIAVVPLFEKNGRKVRGATKYLVGLSNINRYA